jgi:non-specific serine/threonine protein kinase
MVSGTICHYEIIRQLAQGGMGIVYLAKDIGTDELVAIKSLRDSPLGTDGEQRTRFLREAEALRELNHPNIVKMLAVCEQDGQHFIVMEYLEGGTLQERLAKSNGQLPLSEVLDIALQLADALTRAHYLKIIHRDIKPANVLMSADGRACLTDFGVARTETSELTGGGTLLGTMSYLSPEALQGQEASERSDIWSFGVLLFELLTGSHPFSADAANTILVNILSAPPPDLEALRPDLPIQLVDLVYRMLHKDPLQRIASVRLVGAALEAISQGEPADAIPSDAGGGRFKPLTVPKTKRAKEGLPTELTPFIGRANEVEDLVRMLVDEAIRLVTLIGPGGIGKTRLAIETARAIADRFRDGVAFVPLAALDSIDSLLTAIWEAVDYPPVHADSRTPEEQTRDYFLDKDMLLIFDNCEHLLEGTAKILGLLQSAPGVRVLATSTDRLNLRGETLYRLKGVDYPAGEVGKAALEYAAVQLFIDTSRRWRPGFEASHENLPHIVRICQLVQGLPLGLLLASAWVDALSVEEIASEIAEDLDFLSTEMRDVPMRQRSIRAIFEGVWRRLEAEEQQTFANLAVFRGGFDLEAARTIAGASVRQLLSFTNKSLLWRDASDGRYHSHRLLRQYGQEELIRRGDLEGMQRRHAAYFADLAESIDEQLRQPNELPWYARLRDDNDNFIAALDWSLIQENDPLIGGRLFAALGMQWFLTDNVVDGTNWMTRSLKFIDALPADVQARVYNRSGLIGCVQGNYAQAAANHAQAVRLFRQLGDDGHLAYALLAQANMSYAAGMGKTANPLVEESLNFAYRAEEPYFLAVALSTAASFARRAGNEARARQMLIERIKLTESFPNYMIRYGTLRSHAFMAREDGDFKLALAKFEEASVIARELRWRPDELDTIQEIAYTYYRSGDLQRAEHYFRDALRQCREISHFSLIAWNLIGLGMVYLQQESKAAAEAMFRERLLCQPAEESNWQVPLCLAAIGRLAFFDQQEEIAAMLLGASEQIVEHSGYLPFHWFKDDWQEILDELRPGLSSSDWNQGRGMSDSQAVDLALRHLRQV